MGALLTFTLSGIRPGYRTYQKPKNLHQYLHFFSCHSSSVFGGEYYQHFTGLLHCTWYKFDFLRPVA